MKKFYAVCNVKGPISMAICANSVEDAVEVFDMLNYYQIIDSRRNDIKKDYELLDLYDKDTESQFGNMLYDLGLDEALDLDPYGDPLDDGTPRHLTNGWMLWEVF